MANALSEFSPGAMAPPDRLGGRLVPSLAPSRGTLADMYRDILPGSGGVLTSRVVRTVPIGVDGNPVSQNANDVIVDRPAPMFTAAPTIDATDPIDAYRLGIGARAIGRAESEIPKHYGAEGREEERAAWLAGFRGEALEEEGAEVIQ